MYHSITIGSKNTWDDWYLIPSSRPVVNPPKPKTKYIDIPGADGHLDLSTALTGDIAYERREGSWEFYVDNGHDAWYNIYSDILDYLHGQLLNAVLEDDPLYYYEGRFEVNKWKSEPQNSKIVIDYNVAPYKYETYTSLDDWLWDPFNFEYSIIREYEDLRVDGSFTLNIPGIRMKVTPTFIVKSDDGNGLILSYEGNTFNLADGTSRIINIRTHSGDNIFKFTGKGTVSIEYRGGRL